MHCDEILKRQCIHDESLWWVFMSITKHKYIADSPKDSPLYRLYRLIHYRDICVGRVCGGFVVSEMRTCRLPKISEREYKDRKHGILYVYISFAYHKYVPRNVYIPCKFRNSHNNIA